MSKLDLSQDAKVLFDKYTKQVAKNYGGEVGEKYTATPAIQQILVQLLVEKGGWFMPYIGMPFVPSIKGQKVLMSLSSATGSRTDTTGNSERVAKNFAALGTQDYELTKFNNDFKFSYDDFNAWAYIPNFPQFYQSMLMESIANSIVMSGWHGTTAAADTNISTSPLLQDLSIGWLQKIRAYNTGSQWLKASTASCAFADTGDTVTIANHGRTDGDIVSFTVITTTTGIVTNTKYYVISATQNTFQLSATKLGSAIALTANGTGTCKLHITLGQPGFDNLDVLVANTKNSIEPWLRNGLVCYISDNLAAIEEARYYKQTVERTSEKLVLLQNGGEILQTYGGLRCIVPPFFPDNTILIAPVGGLQFYTLNGSIRRQILDWQQGDCIKDFNQRVAGHVIYDERQCFLVEDIA